VADNNAGIHHFVVQNHTESFSIVYHAWFAKNNVLCSNSV